MIFDKLGRFLGLTQALHPLDRLIDARSRPNLEKFNVLANRIDTLSLSVKFFGYELARTLAETLPVCADVPVQSIELGCKASTQADIASDWVAHWCGQLQIPRVYHRKIWELAYVLQAIHSHGAMRPGATGLGFGCGREPLASYLAARGVAVMITDQPPDAMVNQGWTTTAQYTSSSDDSFHPHLVDRARFDELVTLRHVDMNAIPPDLAGYDFCWSVCALEHLGSIEQGLAFVENTLQTVRPGGLSVHTTEFNFANDRQTIDNWPTVLFQRQHFVDLATRLRARGHSVAPLDFDVGSQPLDKFIDLPPYLDHHESAQLRDWASGGTPHLKLAIDGFASTCFGLIVHRAQ